jgi:hypothetical protein
MRQPLLFSQSSPWQHNQPYNSSPATTFKFAILRRSFFHAKKKSGGAGEDKTDLPGDCKNQL